jgi:hypothetical protein
MGSMYGAVQIRDHHMVGTVAICHCNTHTEASKADVLDTLTLCASDSPRTLACPML